MMAAVVLVKKMNEKRNELEEHVFRF